MFSQSFSSAPLHFVLFIAFVFLIMAGLVLEQTNKFDLCVSVDVSDKYLKYDLYDFCVFLAYEILRLKS